MDKLPKIIKIEDKNLGGGERATFYHFDTNKLLVEDTTGFYLYNSEKDFLNMLDGEDVKFECLYTK